MKVRRYKCKCADCDYDCQERISFAPGSHSYTRRFARYVVDLLKGMTLKDTARLLGVSWDTIKEIHTHHLEYHYAPPSLEGVDSIGIDEFAVQKDINKRRVLKGTRYLLLRNGADIFDKEYKTRLDNALEMNKPISQAYYLKEQLREIWMQPNKQAAEKVMLDWVKQAQESKVPQL